MSRPFSNLAGWDYTAMTGHSNVDSKFPSTHARWWPLFFSCFFSLPWVSMGFWPGQWVFGSRHLTGCISHFTHRFIQGSVWRCAEARGWPSLRKSTQSRTTFFADNSSGFGTPQGPKRTSIDGCARDYCIARSWGLPYSLIYWELESRDWNPIPIPAHGHTVEKETGHKRKKKEKKKKKKNSPNRRAKQIPPPIEFLTRRRK